MRNFCSFITAPFPVSVRELRCFRHPPFLWSHADSNYVLQASKPFLSLSFRMTTHNTQAFSARFIDHVCTFKSLESCTDVTKINQTKLTDNIDQLTLYLRALGAFYLSLDYARNRSYFVLSTNTFFSLVSKLIVFIRWVCFVKSCPIVHIIKRYLEMT